MTIKKMTVKDVAERLTKLETISHERWKTAFNEFSDIKEEITRINLTIKTATFGVFGFLGALSIAVVTSMLV
jgi:hypothetical protein|tara:strand:+ start:329 stop:544 length:216 start_codon:yes stop_codon:yes gene_type:complete